MNKVTENNIENAADKAFRATIDRVKSAHKAPPKADDPAIVAGVAAIYSDLDAPPPSQIKVYASLEEMLRDQGEAYADGIGVARLSQVVTYRVGYELIGEPQQELADTEAFCLRVYDGLCYENLCCLVGYPHTYETDDEGQLHCATGPAVAWPGRVWSRGTLRDMTRGARLGFRRFGRDLGDRLGARLGDRLGDRLRVHIVYYSESGILYYLGGHLWIRLWNRIGDRLRDRLTTYIDRNYSSILVHREPPKAREAVRAATVRMRTALVEGLALVPDGPVRLSLERTIALLDTDIRGYQTPGAERLAAKLAADADYYDTLSLSTDADPPQVARDHVTHLLLRAASLALLSMHRGESDDDDAQEIIGLVISAAEAAIGSEVRAEIAAETREAWRAAWKNSEEHKHAVALQTAVAAGKASRLKAAQMAARNMADAINGSVGGHDGQRG